MSQGEESLGEESKGDEEPMRRGGPTRGPDGRTRAEEWTREWKVCDDLFLAKHQNVSDSPGMEALGLRIN